jgi:hypothetical protein
MRGCFSGVPTLALGIILGAIAGGLIGGVIIELLFFIIPLRGENDAHNFIIGGLVILAVFIVAGVHIGFYTAMKYTDRDEES